MDSYQAIYDAVRSRIHGGDVGNAVAEAARQAFDISHLTAGVAQDFTIAAMEMQRPFVLLKPRMFPDGNQWCALYGDNVQAGVAGFGDTPAKAATQFDVEWLNAKCGPAGIKATSSDLLHALERLSAQCDRMRMPGQPESDAERNARAAIAKTTGACDAL